VLLVVDEDCVVVTEPRLMLPHVRQVPDKPVLVVWVRLAVLLLAQIRGAGQGVRCMRRTAIS
jgi:hypothetical protein